MTHTARQRKQQQQKNVYDFHQMTTTEEALNRARRHLHVSRLVSFLSIAAILFVVNTDYIPGDVRFALVAVLLAFGFVAFLIGMHYVFVIPRLEHTALRELAKASPLDRSLRS
jgi:Flp pilus assembly protein TadB